MSGLIILPIFIIYTVIGFFIIKFLLKLFNKKLNSLIILIIVILLPFWDLFLQKGIKTYYQLFNLTKVNIYIQPERDKDGKIESLNIIDYSNLNEKMLYDKEYYSLFKNQISNFLEITANIKDKKEKVRLNLIEDRFQIIEKPKARFTIKKINNRYIYFGMSKIYEAQLIDNKTNNILASVINIEFTNKYSFIRNNIFLLITGTGRSLFKVSGIDKENTNTKINNVFKIY